MKLLTAVSTVATALVAFGAGVHVGVLHSAAAGLPGPCRDNGCGAALVTCVAALGEHTSRLDVHAQQYTAAAAAVGSLAEAAAAQQPCPPPAAAAPPLAAAAPPPAAAAAADPALARAEARAAAAETAVADQARAHRAELQQFKGAASLEVGVTVRPQHRDADRYAAVELGGTAWRRVVSVNGADSYAALLDGWPRRKRGAARALLLAHGGKGTNVQRAAESVAVNASTDLKGTLRALGCEELNVVPVKESAESCTVLLELRTAPPMVMKRVSYDWDTDEFHTRSRYWSAKSGELGLPEAFGSRGERVQAGGMTPSQLILTLLNNLDAASAALAPVLEKVARKGPKGSTTKGSVVVMAVNEGVVDLALNMACSAKVNGVSTSPTVVFTADAALVPRLEALGLTAFYHNALGSLPSKGAQNYGDAAFVAMMWLKVSSVYLCNQLGYDVLFQDADLVWFKDPLDWFHDVADKDVDTFWSDDGARSQRYSPYSANTGFYYVRSNKRTRFFMQRMAYEYDLISVWRSHQHVLNAVLVELNSRIGLTVQLLHQYEFAIGQLFHHDPAFMTGWYKGEHDPYVFHWSWTAGRADKLKYARQTGMWFVKDECDLDHINDPANAATIGGCCLAAVPDRPDTEGKGGPPPRAGAAT